MIIIIDIRCFQIEEEDKFIVIASDGLWEVINNQEVYKYFLILTIVTYHGSVLIFWVNIMKNKI